jgi:hypothetical protein
VKVVDTGAIQIGAALPNVVYFRTRGLHAGIYRTDDGGRRWTRLATPNGATVLTLATHPQTPSIVYASTEGGLWVSRDSGGSWNPVQSADAPKSTGSFTIPPYFNGTAFNSVVTVVREDEPMLVDPQNGHLMHGGLGLRILVGMRSGAP